MSLFRHSRSILKLLLPCLVVAVFFGSVFAFEVKYERCWDTSFDAEIVEIKGHGQLIFAFLTNGKLAAIESNGDLLWSVDLGGKPASNIAVDDSSVWVATYSSSVDDPAKFSSELRSVSIASGIVRSTKDLPMATRHEIRPFEDRLIVASSSGVISSLKRDESEQIWRRELADSFTSNIAVGVSSVGIAAGNQLFILDARSGTISSLTKLESSANVLEFVASGILAIGDAQGGVRLFSESNGRPSWRFRTGGTIRSLTSTNGSLLVGSADNFVYNLVVANGTVKWKRRLVARVTDVAVIEQGRSVVASAIEESDFSVFSNENGSVLARLQPLGGEAPRIRLDVIDNGFIAAKGNFITAFLPLGCGKTNKDG